jgi:stringent starvation protein B
LAVKVDEHTRVPLAYVKDGEIVLNIGTEAVRALHMGNDDITCGGRFGGVSHEIVVPVAAVVGIFAKETGQGLVFQGQESMSAAPEGSDEPPSGAPSGGSRPKSHLRVVK